MSQKIIHEYCFSSKDWQIWWNISISWKVVESSDRKPHWYLNSKLLLCRWLYICLKMIRSWILPKFLKSETGRLFAGIDLSPFLNSGTRFPNFQMSGKIPSFSERLNIIQSGFAITAAIFIIILLLIISEPEALLRSKFTMTFLISSSVISILSNTLSVCSENGGKVACESSSEQKQSMSLNN